MDKIKEIFSIIYFIYIFSRSKQSYGYRSVPARVAGKSHIGKQNGTASPSIPPRMRFWPVPMCFRRSWLFQLISTEIQDSAGMGLLQIKLNLDLLKNLNRPKSIHHSFAQKHCSLLLHMMSCSSNSLTRGILWLMQSS